MQYTSSAACHQFAVRARQKLVLGAERQPVSGAESFEEAFAATPTQPYMPLVADMQLHRHRTTSSALLGISPDGPLCSWAAAEEWHDNALIARRA